LTPGSVLRWLHRRRGSIVVPAPAAYQLWSASYPASAHTPLMRVEQAVIEPMLTKVRPRSALDVGTGSGRYLPLLAGTRAARLVGLDLSLPMLTRHPCEFPRACADARRLPFRDGTFDLVLSSLMAGDIEDLDGWLRELTRVLTHGGHVIYSDFHPTWAANGWRRTFESEDHGIIDVPYFAHTMDAHLSALETAGLHVSAIREPRLDAEDTRSRTMRRRWGRLPVLVIVHAVKTSPAASR
jgi:malonyl-CoA O-methyltransferase